MDRLAAKEGDRSPYDIAQGYAWLGQNSVALDWLDRAVAAHSLGMQWVSYDPMLRSVRKEARYRALLRKLGLPEPAPPVARSVAR